MVPRSFKYAFLTRVRCSFTLVKPGLTLAGSLHLPGGGIPAWGGLPDPVVGGVGGMEGLVPSRPPTLLSERLEIFSFSHMRRLYLASASLSDVETGIQALRAVKKMAGTVQEQLMDSKSGEKETREAARALFDLQVKSGIGLPLALMFTECVYYLFHFYPPSAKTSILPLTLSGILGDL